MLHCQSYFGLVVMDAPQPLENIKALIIFGRKTWEIFAVGYVAVAHKWASIKQIDQLDGNTTGPSIFVRPIGKSFIVWRTLKSDSIELSVIDLTIIKTDLSVDQQYLYDFCNAISYGKCPGDLKSKSLGKFSNGMDDNSK